MSPCAYVDLYILVDWSSSIRTHRAEIKIYEAVRSFILGLSVKDGHIRFGLITFATDASVLASVDDDWMTLFEGLTQLSIPNARGSTQLHKGFDEVDALMNEFQEDNRKNVILIISDGAVSKKDATLLQASQLTIDYGARIFSFAVGNYENHVDFLMNVANAGFFESSYDTLRKTLASIDPCI